VVLSIGRFEEQLITLDPKDPERETGDSVGVGAGAGAGAVLTHAADFS
jgi:hypothetical protein